MDLNTLQMFLGMFAAMVMQWLKGQSWFSLISEDSEKWIKVAFSFVVAAASSIGVTITCDLQVAHSCTIGGLDFHTITTLLSRTAMQFIIQHVTHAGLSAYSKK